MEQSAQRSNGVKVAYLVAQFPVLSETFISNEVDGLRRLGVQPLLLSFTRPSPADADKLGEPARRLIPEVRYIRMRDALLAGVLRPLWLARAWREHARLRRASTRKSNSLLQLLRAIAVARQIELSGVRHVHAHWPYAAQVADLVREILGVSYSVSIHAHEVEHDSGHFPVIFERLAFAAFCNRGAMSHLLRHLGADVHHRAHLVYHGVDLAAFSFLPMPDEARTLHILSAGRLTRTKGFDRLIRACALASREGLNVRLTILGRGALALPLLRLAEELGFANRLTMPGWVSPAEVRAHIRTAHAFALLADTGYHDGLPNVVLEAMASGRPVILSPLPAASEVISNGVEGFVLRGAEDFAGFIAALRRLRAEPTVMQTMGAAARQRVAAEHDARIAIERMAGLLQRHAS
jgi:glycosyltransferase involved in cell wall biosynthesis